MQYDTEDKRLGGGIITICVLHIIGFVITILGTILAFSMKNNLKVQLRNLFSKLHF